MLPHWKHLVLEQWVAIAHGLAQGETLKSIAAAVGAAKATTRARRSSRFQETELTMRIGVQCANPHRRNKKTPLLFCKREGACMRLEERELVGLAEIG